MSQKQTQDIELGIVRLEYGDAARPQRAVLTISTGKGYNGLRSSATVFWHGENSRSTLLGMGGPGGDFGKSLKVSDRSIKATQRNIDKQHAEVFTPEAVAQLVEAAKAHYAAYVRADQGAQGVSRG